MLNTSSNNRLRNRAWLLSGLLGVSGQVKQDKKPHGIQSAESHHRQVFAIRLGLQFNTALPKCLSKVGRHMVRYNMNGILSPFQSTVLLSCPSRSCLVDLSICGSDSSPVPLSAVLEGPPKDERAP